MAVLPDAVEILDYIPPEPANAVTLDDRYIVVVDGARDEFAVFDTDSETSDAFSGCGKMAQTSPTGVRRNVVEHGGYAYTVGLLGGWSIIRIGSNGMVTSKTIPNTLFYGLSFATVGISGGNLWYGWYGNGVRVGWMDLTSWTITQVAGSGASGNYRIACTPTTVYQNGTKRWDGATGVALADGPYLELDGIGNPQVDNNILWSAYGSNFRKLDLTTGSAETYSAGFAVSPGTVCHGPNNLVYANQTYSPYTGLAVIDKTTGTVGKWDYPIGRTYRYTLAYAAGKMWALAGETP